MTPVPRLEPVDPRLFGCGELSVMPGWTRSCSRWECGQGWLEASIAWLGQHGLVCRVPKQTRHPGAGWPARVQAPCGSEVFVIDEHDVALFLGLNVGKGEHYAVPLDRSGRRCWSGPCPTTRPGFASWTGDWASTPVLRVVDQPSTTNLGACPCPSRTVVAATRTVAASAVRRYRAWAADLARSLVLPTFAARRADPTWPTKLILGDTVGDTGEQLEAYRGTIGT